MTKHIHLLCTIAILAASFTTSLAQNRAIDSLRLLIKNAKEDTLKVKHLSALCGQYSENLDSMIQITRKSFALAEKLSWEKGIVREGTKLGSFYFAKGNVPKAMEFNFKVLKIQEARLEQISKEGKPELIIDAKKKVSAALLNLGITFTFDKSDFGKALEYYNKSLKIAEETGYLECQSVGLGNIATLLCRQGEFEKSLEYFFKALKIAEELNDKISMERTLGNLAGAYLDIKNYSESLKYYIKARQLSSEAGIELRVQYYTARIAQVYIKMPGLPSPEGETLTGFKLAEKYLQNALVFSDSVADTQEMIRIYESLSELYEVSTTPLKDTLDGKELSLEQMRVRAIYYLRKGLLMKDTLFTAENKAKQVQLELNYESEKKEAALFAQQQRALEEEKRLEEMQYMGIVSVILLVIAFVFIATRVQLSLKVIDFAGFVGVLLFFQFIEALLHPTITHYTHGLPVLLVAVNIALASSIKPLHHLVEKRLIKISHTMTERRKIAIERAKEEEALRLAQIEADALRQAQDDAQRADQENNDKPPIG